jgi:hypothetical protein
MLFCSNKHDPETAFYRAFFYAIVAALLAATLMLCYGADWGGALRIGAHIALIYAVVMMIDAGSRSSRPRGEIHDSQRPLAEAATLPTLRFAEGGSAVAITLSGTALFL